MTYKRGLAIEIDPIPSGIREAVSGQVVRVAEVRSLVSDCWWLRGVAEKWFYKKGRVRP